MFELDISKEINDMANTMVEMVYSVTYSECLQSITQLSQMGMNATWADDIYKCFYVTPTVEGNSISVSIDIDIGQEFALMSEARDKNIISINGQDTNEDSDKSGEDWIQNDPLNISENVRMILDNIRIRCQNISNEVYSIYRDSIKEKISTFATNKIKEAIAT